MNVPSPLVGVIACRKLIDDHPFHCVGEKYLSAVAHVAKVTPVILPALQEVPDLAPFAGLLLTGSPSNIAPRHYGAPAVENDLADPERDVTSLALIPAALAAGVPLLAICRGFQELNVALGGTLDPQLARRPPGSPWVDHYPGAGRPKAEQYAIAHPVAFAPGGLLADLAGGDEAVVNSVHHQGIARLAEGLVVEATAPDGLVEAARVAWASAFALGVLWHPECRAAENPLSVALLGAFGAACRQRLSS
ncbi:MAG: gamma-glutamyl-gamma-aminobutyrate hydrolase family protein [Candidatus Competibacterales bacterium]